MDSENARRWIITFLTLKFIYLYKINVNICKIFIQSGKNKSIFLRKNSLGYFRFIGKGCSVFSDNNSVYLQNQSESSIFVQVIWHSHIKYSGAIKPKAFLKIAKMSSIAAESCMFIMSFDYSIYKRNFRVRFVIWHTVGTQLRLWRFQQIVRLRFFPTQNMKKLCARKSGVVMKKLIIIPSFAKSGFRSWKDGEQDIRDRWAKIFNRIF